jgi:peptidoglycan hydrolase-like amidase
VLSLALDGSAGSVTVSGDDFRRRLALRSTLLTVVPPPAG